MSSQPSYNSQAVLDLITRPHPSRGQPMTTPQTVRLLHNGPNQVLNIPQEFELPSEEVMIRKDGNKLIIEPVQSLSLLALLSTLSPIEDEFPNIDAELLPLDDVDL